MNRACVPRCTNRKCEGGGTCVGNLTKSGCFPRCEASADCDAEIFGVAIDAAGSADDDVAVCIANQLPIHTCNPNDFSDIDSLVVIEVPHPEH